MKKILTGIIIIFITTLLSGCFNNNFEQNQIVSPEPINMELHGSWKVLSEVVVNEDLSEKSKSNIGEYDTIIISKEYVSFGDTYVENPKFKLKRVRKNSLLEDEFKNITLDELEGLPEFVDVIDVYDKNNVYFNFIKGNQVSDSKNYYIYITGTLMKIEKVAESSPQIASLDMNVKSVEQSNSDLQENILSPDKNYYQMDSGVLLGLKNPTVVNENGIVEEATYRTLWISLKNGVIQPIKELDNILLVPRLNGFSKIQFETTDYYWGEEDKLIVTSNKKDEDSSKNVLSEKNVCREINFVGSDYIGLEYYDTNNLKGGCKQYKIIPIDSVNSIDSIDLISIFGENIKDNYSIAKKKAEDISEINYSDETIYLNDYRNVNMVRKNGQWVLEARAMSESNNEYIDFSLNVSPINTLINYDGLILPWNKLKEFDPKIRDSISSPNARMIITLSDNKLLVYETIGGKINKELAEIPIEANESIIMSEWATGDFVTYWGSEFDYNNGKVIN